MFISDDPNQDLWPKKLVEGGVLQISSIAEVYGDRGLVRPAEQRSTFADALREAIDHGYTGIRVAADNTSLVATPERLQAWLEWEPIADGFMAQNPVTGLCAFDRSRTDPASLGEVMHLHQTRVDT